MALSIPIITEYVGTGLDKFKKELAQAETNSQKAGLVMKKAFLPATAALGAMAVALGDATKAAIADEAAASELARSLRATTGATDDIIASTEDWISTQGKLLGIADDQLRPALSRLARATGSVEKAQKLATQAMDIAQATGKPLETVVQALERAYGGNMTALQRLAPEYRTLIKSGADFETVMAALAQTTGGAAANAANTAEGQFKRMSLALDETKESIGAALLPAVEAVLPFLQRMAAWAQDNPNTFLIIAGALGAIAASIVAINIAMALNPFGLIAAGVIALVAGIAIAYQRFEGFRNIVDAVFNGLKWYVGMAKEQFLALVGIFKTVFNALGSAWNNTIGKLSIKIPDIPGLPGRGTEFSFPKIPALADGGIVTGPTLALIGEAGPEAVVPLDRYNGGGMNITVNAGLVSTPDQIGQEIIQAIQKAQRRSGVVFAPA